ncbi:MAG TPA: hypothetical protein VH120_20310, partial [Gemmataceae bacterium]|nr:hypothetical protein [Gemmataceae bacterium]
ESPAPTTVPPPASPGADSYLASRRMIENDSWLAAAGTGSGTPPAPPAEPQVLRAWPGVSAELPP